MNMPDKHLRRKPQRRWGGTYIWFDDLSFSSAVVFRHWWQRRWRFRVFYGRKINNGVQSIQSFETEAEAIEAIIALTNAEIIDLKELQT
jgi:hypothetical protein